MKQLLASGIYLLFTVLAVRWLWAYWTPQCNEACPSSIIIAIYFTLAFALLTGSGIFALTAFGRLSTKQGLYSCLAALIVVVGCALILTVVLQSRGVAQQSTETVVLGRLG